MKPPPACQEIAAVIFVILAEKKGHLKKPITWDDCKLMFRQNHNSKAVGAQKFYELLANYDYTTVKYKALARVEKMMENPALTPKNLRNISAWAEIMAKFVNNWLIAAREAK